jgi:hypothetical protein
MRFTIINIIGVAALALIAFRYNQEFTASLGSITSNFGSAYNTVIGAPGGQALPAAPIRG